MGPPARSSLTTAPALQTLAPQVSLAWPSKRRREAAHPAGFLTKAIIQIEHAHTKLLTDPDIDGTQRNDTRTATVLNRSTQADALSNWPIDNVPTSFPLP